MHGLIWVISYAFGVPPDEIDIDTVQNAARIAEIHNFSIQDMPIGGSIRLPIDTMTGLSPFAC
jgi:hypothetical protein